MSIEAEGVQRPHANTSQGFFFFLLIFLNCSFFHSGYSESTGPTARTASVCDGARC